MSTPELPAFPSKPLHSVSPSQLRQHNPSTSLVPLFLSLPINLVEDISRIRPLLIDSATRVLVQATTMLLGCYPHLLTPRFPCFCSCSSAAKYKLKSQTEPFQYKQSNPFAKSLLMSLKVKIKILNHGLEGPNDIAFTPCTLPLAHSVPRTGLRPASECLCSLSPPCRALPPGLDKACLAFLAVFTQVFSLTQIPFPSGLSWDPHAKLKCCHLVPIRCLYFSP